MLRRYRPTQNNKIPSTHMWAIWFSYGQEPQGFVNPAMQLPVMNNKIIVWQNEDSLTV